MRRPEGSIAHRVLFARTIADSLAIRPLLASVIQQIGVGNNLGAGDGMEATEMMRDMRHNPVKVGASEIDVINFDWVISPVDGGALLRWVRRHKESLNPFMALFMICGYCDEERIAAARDLAVIDIIAKPEGDRLANKSFARLAQASDCSLLDRVGA